MPIPTVHTLAPAYDILQRLGGKTQVANHLGLDKSTLSRWCQPRPSGTGGMIPQRYWPQLMQMARLQRVKLRIEELVTVEV